MEPQKSVRPYGSWSSPISAELVAQAGVRLGQPMLSGNYIYWLESRPTQGGRQVLVRCGFDANCVDLTPHDLNVRTRVHEYGGGDYTVSHGNVYFSNFSDQRVYCQKPGEPAQPVTPPTGMRFADFAADSRRNKLVAVREEHTSGREPTNTIVSLDLCCVSEGNVLVAGNDFYASPRLSPDGKRMLWLTWNHPNMPWDGTELWVADIDSEGDVSNARLLAGGKNESIFQPQWAEDGSIYFVSDRSGWYNIYREQDAEIRSITQMQAEFGRPQWVFGMRTYAVLSPSRLICTYCSGGIWYLASIDTESLEMSTYDLPYSSILGVAAAHQRVVFWAGSPTNSGVLVLFDPSNGRSQVLRASSDVQLDPGYVSVPSEIEFPTEGSLTAHAFFYAPKNRDYEPPVGEKPPVLVISHGGPTGSASSVLDFAIQYWTSRGIAVLDVNYGGSANYGRSYRERLKGTWGLTDVSDCVNAVRYMAECGAIDLERAAIRGGSAGGYTTLAALTFTDVFKAGASYYGVSDLELLARDTHKFESRYLDGLIGEYPAKKRVYHERSPINFTHRLSCPVIFFQGLEDKVVPPNQAELMAEDLKNRGLPVAYVVFEAEGHGFRQAENIKKAISAEYYFYSKVFGFEPANGVEPVVIFNME